MVHAVHDPISPWNQKRTTLNKPSGKIKDTFPVFAGCVHFVGGKTMQKERMEE
jgi:hypothetical protein